MTATTQRLTTVGASVTRFASSLRNIFRLGCICIFASSDTEVAGEECAAAAVADTAEEAGAATAAAEADEGAAEGAVPP